MALNLKNPEVEQLVTEVAEMTGESKTEAVRTAMLERRSRLMSTATTGSSRVQRLRDFLEYEIWPHIPAEQLGQPITKEEMDGILGYGPEGV